MKKIHIIPLLMAGMLIASAGCGKKQDLSKASDSLQSRETVFDPSLSGTFNGTQGLLDYAARLEAAGNREAAAAVYAFVGRTSRKEMENSVEEIMEEDTFIELQFLAEMAQANGRR